jgi:membrane-associated phospholipid phosphatase
MRSSEWIQSGFAIILAAAAWIRPLTARRRWVTTLLAAFVLGALGLVRYLARVLDPFPLSIIRDWLPIVLLFVPYWQTGQFFMGPDTKIQEWLMESDRRWLARVAPVTGRLSAGVRLSMEFAYTFCYPLVPLGLGVLYVAGLRRYADTYWFVVLVATYLCYAITLFVPAMPPRSVACGDQLIAPAPSKGRAFNHWLQRWGSIQAISFPSAHVASTIAASLMLLWFVPLAGVIFLAISVWIGVAAFVGRYHYALDVLLGAAMALAVFLAWACHLIPSSFIATPAIALVAAV